MASKEPKRDTRSLMKLFSMIVDATSMVVDEHCHAKGMGS